MSWRPIVVGVDESDEAVHAAELAVRLAKLAGAPCHLGNQFYFAVSSQLNE